MDSTIIAAIIGALSTVGAAVGTLVFTRLGDNMSFTPTNVRQITLVGQWEGIVHQQGSADPYDLRIAITLKSTRRAIRGEGTVHGATQNQVITQPIVIIGKFVHDRFLKIEYEMRDHPGVIQFGFSLLELSPDGQTLDGRFLGFGALISRGPVWGTLQMHKKGSTPRLASQTTI